MSSTTPPGGPPPPPPPGGLGRLDPSGAAGTRRARTDASEISVLLSRLLDLTALAAAPDAVRDAALEVCSAMPSPDAGVERSAEALATACRAVGLSASVSRVPLEVVLPTIGPGQPAIGWAHIDGRMHLALVTETSSTGLWIEIPGEEAPRLVPAAAWTDAFRSNEATPTWVLVEAPVPRGGSGAPQAHGGAHGDPSHGAPPRARLWAWMRLERHDLFTVLVYAVFVGVLTLTTPIAVQALVNTVAFGTLLQPLVVLSLLLLGALAFAATLRGIQFWVVEVLQRRIFVRVIADLARRLPRVRRDALDGHDGPELANRFFEVVTIQKAASSLLLDGLEIALTVGVGMLVLAFYHPFLLGFDLLLVVAMGAGIWMGRRGPETAIEESKRKYELAAWLEELTRHDVAFKLGGALGYAEMRADALTRSWLDARKAHFSVVARQFALVLTMQALAGASVLGIGGWLVIQRQLTLGQLVAAELIVTVVVTSMAKMGKYLEIYYDLLAALDKLGHLVDLPTEREGGAPCVPAVAADGTAQGVTLIAHELVAGYGDGPDVLRGASFRLAPGSRNALVGADGSGKSLLVEVIAALREPRGGHVSIDGWDSRALDVESLRERIAVVRSAAMLPASVLENVRMGRPHVDAQAVRDALAAVGLLDAIDRLPDGIHTLLTATGDPLSPGERARVMIARAIAARPALLVVDDALDALQPSLRGRIFDVLADPARGWTLLVVSDDPVLHARCDQTLWLDGGVVRDEPPPRSSILPQRPEAMR